MGVYNNSTMEPTAPNTQRLVIPKTETEYNVKSLRFLLLTVTFMFLVISSLMIVMGMSVYSYYHLFSFFYSSGRFFTPSIMTVLLGMLFWIVWSFGFFGALKQSTCMINTYACFIALVLFFKFIMVTIAFTTSTEKVISYINIPVHDYATDPEIEREIDYVQTVLNCCGSESYLDYNGMAFTANHSVVAISKESEDEKISMVVPESCCVTTDDVYCLRMRASGCKSALVNLISQNAYVLGLLGVSVMFIELLGIIFALLLARWIRKLKSEQALMAWRIKEKMIMARKKKIMFKTDESTSVA